MAYRNPKGPRSNDFLQTSGEDETLSAGSGNDVIGANQRFRRFDLGVATGKDHLLGGAGADTIYSATGSGETTLDGGTGRDLLDAYTGRNSLIGGDGDDTLISAYGTDTLDAGGGDDTLHIHGDYDRKVIANAGSGDDLVLVHGRLDHIGRAGVADITISLGAGIDRLSIGAAQLSTTAADDLIRITDFTAGVNGDVVLLDQIKSLSTAASYQDLFAKGYIILEQSGADTLLKVDLDGSVGDRHKGQMLLTLQKVQASLLTVHNFAYGFGDALSFVAPDGSAAVTPVNRTSGSGNTSLTGTVGNDYLQGGNGNDSISGDYGSDTLIGGAGKDTLNGDAGSDLLVGEAGDDVLSGGAGRDILQDSEGSNTLSGGDGDDELQDFGTGGTEKILLQGGTGDDRIVFNTRIDGRVVSIEGGDGDDVIAGVSNGRTGLSTISISTGAGNDRITLDAAEPVDGPFRDLITITDFKAGEDGDVLILGTLLQSLGTQAFNRPVKSGFVRLLQSGSNSLVQVDRDGAAGTAFTFETLVTLTGVTVTNLRTDNFDAPVFHPTGAADTLTGTNLDDIMVGSMVDESIVGLAGNDSLDGAQGDDTLDGGRGDDSLVSGFGNDVVRGGAGRDTLQGGAGDDRYEGGDGDDLFFAEPDGEGNDTIVAGSGDDVVTLVSGHDRRIVIDLGSGDDTVYIRPERLAGQQRTLPSQFTLTLGGGRDVIGVDAQLAREFSVPDIVDIADFQAGEGGDMIDLDYSIKTVIPSGGYLNGNPFDQGYLRIEQRGADTHLLLDIDAVGDRTQAVSIAILRKVLGVDLTADNFRFKDQRIDPHAMSESLSATYVSGTLTDGEGSARVAMGAGNDTVIGNGGDDSIQGGGGKDHLTGGTGRDTLNGGDGDDLLIDDAGDGLFDGGSGDDQIFASGLTRKITVLAGDGDDLVRIGWNSDDTKADYLALVTLGLGVDTIRPDAGRLFIGQAGDIITVTDFVAGDGGDIVDLSGVISHLQFRGVNVPDPFASGYLQFIQAGSDTQLRVDRDGTAGQLASELVMTLQNVSRNSLTRFNVINPNVSPNGGVNNFSGSGARDRISGTLVADSIAGQSGDDFLQGFAGNDTLNGGSGADTLYGDDGNDLLQGGVGEDFLNADTGVDTVLGGEGDDEIRISESASSASVDGEAGDDYFFLTDNTFGPTRNVTVIGGAGEDLIETHPSPFYFHFTANSGFATLTLGAGVDTFILTAGRSQRLGSEDHYRITDFTAGAAGDRIDLSRLLNSLGFHEAIPEDNPFATGYLRLQQVGADTKLMVDFSGPASSTSYISVLTLTGVTATSLTSDNFIVGSTGKKGNIDPTGADPTPIVAENSTGTVNGTTAADRITLAQGGFTGNVINARGGADTLSGGSGRDTINAGSGDDLIETDGAGNDLVNGETGNDTLYDGEGNDTLNGGSGADLIFVGNLHPFTTGANTVDGGDGGDRISLEAIAQASNQVVRGGAGADSINLSRFGGSTITQTTITLDGGDGEDRVNINNDVDRGATLLVTLGLGSDTLSISGIKYAASPTGRVLDRITVSDFRVGAGGDVIELNDLLSPLGTSDAFSAGLLRNPFKAGYLRLNELAGGNALSPVFTTELQVDADGANGSVHGFVTVVSLTGVRKSSLTADNFALINLAGGSDTPVSPDGAGLTLTATGSTVDINGTNGDDTIVGHTGADRLTGHAGSDVIQGGDGDDTITDGDGNDLVEGGSGRDELYAFGKGNDTLSAGDGDDFISYGSFGEGSIDAGEGDDRINAQLLNAHKLTVVAGAGDDLLDIAVYSDSSQAGRCVIELGDGRDTVFLNRLKSGALFKDFATGTDGDVLLLDHFLSVYPAAGADGFETGYFALRSIGSNTELVFDEDGSAGGEAETVIIATFENLRPDQFVAANFNGHAPGGVHRIVEGTAADENFSVGRGNASVAAGAGNDNIRGGLGKQTIDGGDGNDVIASGDGTALIRGGTGKDVISVNGVANTVDGGDGDDLITFATFRQDNRAQSFSGGDGDDVIRLSLGIAEWKIVADGGSGDDHVSLQYAYFGFTGNNIDVLPSVSITLGAGVDTATLNVIDPSAGKSHALPEITDFATGVEGDILDLATLLAVSSTHLNPILIDYRGDNPFKTGHLRLQQDGTSTLLMVDRDAAFASEHSSVAVLRLLNTTASNFVRENFLQTQVNPDSAIAVGGGTGNDTLSGGRGNDTVIGNDGDDSLTGGDGGDSVEGGGGNDTLDGGPGGDVLNGGAGDDVYRVDSVSDLVVELLGEGDDTVFATISYIMPEFVERLVLSGPVGSVRSGVGNGLGNGITGGASNDIISGGGGGDALDGGLGDDVLDGGIGNDLLTGGLGNDSLVGGFGIDSMIGGVGDDTYVVDDALDQITELTDGGTDTVETTLEETSLDATALGNQLENLVMTGERALKASGNALSNKMVGNLRNNLLSGGAGNDILDGGLGTDTLIGGLGNDTYLLSISLDIVVESQGEGVDHVKISADSYVLGRHIEKLTLEGKLDVNGSGNDLGNVVTGNVGSNRLAGLTGNDTLFGDAGNDTLDGGEGNDSVNGGDGDDRVIAGLGPDVIVAGGGNDTIMGGAGRDVMTGGAGADVFVFEETSDSSIFKTTCDVISDFTGGVGGDRIDLRLLDADSATSGDEAFTELLGTGVAFTRAGQLKFAKGVLTANMDADADAEFAVLLTGVNVLALSDLML